MAYYTDIIEDKNGETQCGLCKISIRNSDIFIEAHLNDTEHANKYMERLYIQNNIEVNDRELNCGLCNSVTYVSEILEHLDSPQHNDKKNQVKKLVEKDGGLLVLPENISNIGSAVDCLACDRCVDFNPEAIKSHIETPKHRRARAIAVQPSNAIFSVENSDNDLWCKICQVYFENYIEVIFEHVDEDPGHTKNLRDIYRLIKDQNINIEKYLHDPKEDKALCKQCGIEVPCNTDNLERHIRGRQHQKSSSNKA